MSGISLLVVTFLSLLLVSCNNGGNPIAPFSQVDKEPSPSTEDGALGGGGDADDIGGGDDVKAKLNRARFNAVFALRSIQSLPSNDTLCVSSLLGSLSENEIKFCQTFIREHLGELLAMTWEGTGSDLVPLEDSKQRLSINRGGEEVFVKALTQLGRTGAIVFGPEAFLLSDADFLTLLFHELIHKLRHNGAHPHDVKKFGPFANGADGIDFLALSMALHSPLFSRPQPALVDASWNNTGTARADLLGDDYVNHLAWAPQNRVLVAGTTFIDDRKIISVVRYLPNGKLDNSFGVDGTVRLVHSEGSLWARGIKQLADGKIIVLGRFVEGENIDGIAVFRLNANGAIDRDFGTQGSMTTSLDIWDYPEALDVQGDGKIVIAGRLHGGTSFRAFAARFLASGELDSGFGTNGVFAHDYGNGDDSAFALEIREGKEEEDRRIYLAGQVTSGSRYPAIWCLDSTGKLDSRFGNAGLSQITAGASIKLFDLEILENGKIAAVGSNGQDGIVVQISANGTLDNGFNNGQPVFFAYQGVGLYSVTADSEGRLFVVGRQSSSAGEQGFVAAYTPTGAPDATFGSNGLLWHEPPRTSGENSVYTGVLLDAEVGTLLVGGYLGTSNTGYDFAFWRWWI